MWLRHEGRSSALLRSSEADLPQHSSRERVVCGGSLRTKPPIELMPTNGSLKLFCPNQTRSGPSADYSVRPHPCPPSGGLRERLAP